MHGRWKRAALILLLLLAVVPAVAGAGQSAGGVRWVIVQFQPGRDQQANIDSIAMSIELAGSVGADFVLLPELATTTYPWGSGDEVRDYYIDAAEAVPAGATCQRFAALAAQYEMYVGWGMAESDGAGGVYNSFVMIGPDGSHIGTYRKVHLVPGIERTIFLPGSSVELLSTSFGEVGILICFDRRFPELARAYALQGADLLVVASATNDREVDEFLLPTRAYENDVWLLFANQVGPHPQSGVRPMHGDSRIIDPLGVTRGRASAEAVELLVVDITPQDLALGSGILAWRRPEVYSQPSGAIEETAEGQTGSPNGTDPEPGAESAGGVDLAGAIVVARQRLMDTSGAGTGSGDESLILYVLPRVITTGERIESWTQTVFEATNDSWFFFVDFQPAANWEHPAEYLFVNGATGEVTIVAATEPPTNFSELLVVPDEPADS